MLHANFIALCFVQPELWPIKVLLCGNGEFCVFCCCDLDLDQMTFIYEPDPYPVKRYSQTKNKLSTLRLS